MNSRRFSYIAIWMAIFIILSGIYGFSYAGYNGYIDGRKIQLIEGYIVHVSDSGITIYTREFNRSVSAEGNWIYIGEGVGRANWTTIKDFIPRGRAKILVLNTFGEETSDAILLALKTEHLIMVRIGLMRRAVKVHRYSFDYQSLYGKIVKVGENYIILKRGEIKILVVIPEDSIWFRAGSGKDRWINYREVFSEGDILRIFFHDRVVFKDRFAKFTGLKVVIWGYSGAIIDLTNGETLVRV